MIGFASMILNYILVSMYDEPKKATIFYQKPSYNNKQVLIVEEPGIIEVTNSRELCGITRTLTEYELQKLKDEEAELQEVKRQIFLSVASSDTRCMNNQFTRIVNILFRVTNCVGACCFYYLALPSLCPSSYVIRYYILKMMIECIQMGL